MTSLTRAAGLAILAAGLASAAPHRPPQASCSLAGPAVTARWSGTIPAASTTEAPLRVHADVPLPGTGSRFDYQSPEEASGRLFISHMGAGRVVVFDVRGDRVLANLAGFPTVTGVLDVPPEHRAYASAAGDRAVAVRASWPSTPSWAACTSPRKRAPSRCSRNRIER